VLEGLVEGSGAVSTATVADGLGCSCQSGSRYRITTPETDGTAAAETWIRACACKR